MAKELQYKSDIEQGKVVESWHVSQSVDAFSATNQAAYDISVSGSFKVTGSQFISPTELNEQTRGFVLSYDDTTGQIFKMTTSSISDEDDGNEVYRTGSNDCNIIPAKFGDGFINEGTRSTIAAGFNNKIEAKGDCSFIAAGRFNTASGALGFIGGGEKNKIGDSGTDGEVSSGIVAGVCNRVEADYTVIGGGVKNTASGNCSFIGGGLNNEICTGEVLSFIGGGQCNVIDGDYSAIGGGTFNTASGQRGFIGGGTGNRICVNKNYSTIAGGFQNVVDGSYGFVGGGYRNTASRNCTAVVGGNNNLATGAVSFIGGGRFNQDLETI